MSYSGAFGGPVALVGGLGLTSHRPRCLRIFFMTSSSSTKAIKKPNRMECLIHFLSASCHLERVADHAANIVQHVVCMIEGEIVRHRPENFQALVEKDSASET
jgi:phosphate uptake regulator